MKVLCAPNVEHSARQVQASTLFARWARRLRRTTLGTVMVYKTFAWGGEIRMIQMGVQRPEFEEAVFLRGPTVDMLTVVTDGRNRFVVHVEQPRIPVGQVVRSNPAGMVDTGESPAVAALRELGEEVGSHIKWGSVQPMHAATLGTAAPLLVSPGGMDEEVTFCVVEGHLPSAELGKLTRRIGGLAQEGERLRIRLTPFDGGDVDAALQALCRGRNRPDLKAVTSLLLYGRYLRRR